jgi:2-polyprenyl-3-methyl-5-hydroxy-6-metoxy-1,4-benzoquinol methylase
MSVANRPDHLAKLYENYAKSRSSFARCLANIFSTHAGQPSWEEMRVLDIGCGDGGIARFFASLGAHVTGVECDLGRVYRMLAEGPNFNLVAADGHHLPLSERFD